MLVVDGFGHERHRQDDDAGDNEEDDGEVEVVDATDDCGTVTGLNAAAGPIHKLSDHPGDADEQADHQAVKCTLGETETWSVWTQSPVATGNTRSRVPL